MILIVTHKEDYTADFVVDKLNKRDIPYFRLNCEDCILQDVQIFFDSSLQGFSINGISKFSSVWYRRTKYPEIKARAQAEYIYLINEADAFMRNLFGMISAKWLSDPYAIEKSENKFLQLSIAQRTGLSIPKTLITTNKETLRNFINRNNKSIIKPISQGRILYPENNEKLIFTNVLSTDLIDSLHEYELTPAIFQEFVEKDYEIRVTVVGTSIFAARINSQADEQSRIDWRRKRLTFEKYSLPKHIEEKCIKMMCELRINFAAFDFIRTPSGEYVFLELNPNGQWVWIEQDTKLKISDAIIKYLS